MTTFHVLSPWHAARAARVIAGPSMDGSPISLSSRRGRFAPHLFILSSSLRAPSSKSAEVSPSIGSGKAKH
jgi:hypothetical protein